MAPSHWAAFVCLIICIMYYYLSFTLAEKKQTTKNVLVGFTWATCRLLAGLREQKDSSVDPWSKNKIVTKKNIEPKPAVSVSFLFFKKSNFTNFLERLAGRHKEKTPHLFLLLIVQKDSALKLSLAAPVYHLYMLVYRPTFWLRKVSDSIWFLQEI